MLVIYYANSELREIQLKLLKIGLLGTIWPTIGRNITKYRLIDAEFGRLEIVLRLFVITYITYINNTCHTQHKIKLKMLHVVACKKPTATIAHQ